ncbi:MAG: DUF4097 family beta strand repeat-containing protein [Vicinamibacterales bacterium]|nr:DUF4097 family beta strand repeat-containing protein [Vicinamibacterales bacterium]
MHTKHALAGILAASLLLAATPAPAAMVCSTGDDPGVSWGEPQQTERFSKTVALGSGGSVALSNISGNVVVTGGAGDQVIIDAVKRGRTTDDLKNIEIEVIATEGRVEITTRHPRRDRGWGNNAEVHYTLTVPRRAKVRVKTVSGDIQLTTVDGDVRAESVSGDVRVSDVAQIEGVVSVSGNVVLKSASSSGPVTLSSVSGDVTLVAVKAPSLSGSSVSGDVGLTDVTAERVAFKSVSGNLTFSGPLAKAGRYALKSHSGDVVFKILNTMGFEVNATSFSGDIHSDVPLTVRFGGDESRRGRRQEMRGTFGDGSAVLELNTFSGNVRIVSSTAGAKPATPVKK